MSKLKLRTLEPTEAQIQATILAYLGACPSVAWAHRFNTGAVFLEATDSKGRKRRRFVRFAFPGCADILGQLKDGRFLAVECKAKTGCATQKQRAFLELVADNGGVAVLARSLEDVVQALGCVRAADAS